MQKEPKCLFLAVIKSYKKVYIKMYYNEEGRDETRLISLHHESLA